MSKQSRQAKAVAEKYGIDTRLTWDKRLTSTALQTEFWWATATLYSM